MSYESTFPDSVNGIHRGTGVRKTFVYLTEEERRLVDEAAASERRSISSFIANAAVEAAERIVSRAQRKR